MFRKSRGSVTPSVGRPPSPPPPSANGQSHVQPEILTVAPPTMPSKVENGNQTPSKPAANAAVSTTKPKSSSKAKNTSILNFFKKSGPDDAPSSAFNTLFVQSRASQNSPSHSQATPASKSNGTLVKSESFKTQSSDDHDPEELSRFNEDDTPIKRRRLSLSPSAAIDTEAQYREDAMGTGEKGCTPPPPENDEDVDSAVVVNSLHNQGSGRHIGPFVDESDSEEELPFFQYKSGQADEVQTRPQEPPDEPITSNEENAILHEGGEPPLLKREETTLPDENIFADFEGMGDFEDEYPEGEEFMERRYYLEQRRLELEEQGFEDDLEGETLYDSDIDAKPEIDEIVEDSETPQIEQGDSSIPTCPICNASFAGVSDQEASVHVNHCLDGNPTPLPSTKSTDQPKPDMKQDTRADIKQATTTNSSSFKPPKRAAKPAQANPFSLAQAPSASSAFSKLMSAHAEDAAWATAAASENAARGKPAYQRTCPFYKILPGFNICVDAFRYGAVQGCNAYFLSHFHSDHYVGLTATWNHGPIYCSRPTANLVRQQLRVDPSFVVDVEFEKQFEVPGTGGVQVTMIPANHCPGSSLFLFEKTIGAGKNPKIQRVLHCGDFRACPAHVEHALLKPDVVDSINGKTRQQKLDVCYLDTTYLNPRYAFPSQEDVIKACADMCVSLNKEKVDLKDDWERMKREQTGNSMINFVRKASTNEESKEDSYDAEAAEPADETLVTNGDSVLDDAKPLDNSISTTTATTTQNNESRGRLLVVVGTYSIGKERICLGIAKALNSKIYAPPGKQRIVACLEDPELNRLLTKDPREAQVHMTPLFEIRAETLTEYLAEFRHTFSRAVAFRPSGWNYRPPGSRFVESPAISTVLFSENWKSKYSVRDLVPQRGSNSRAATYGVPYSEHSSFRELTMFCCALRIDKIIPTVNVGSAKSRERMKVWVERWNTYKKKDGLFRIASQDKDVDENQTHDMGASTATQKPRGAWYPGKGTWELRTTL